MKKIAISLLTLTIFFALPSFGMQKNSSSMTARLSALWGQKRIPFAQQHVHKNSRAFSASTFAQFAPASSKFIGIEKPEPHSMNCQWSEQFVETIFNRTSDNKIKEFCDVKEVSCKSCEYTEKFHVISLNKQKCTTPQCSPEFFRLDVEVAKLFEHSGRAALVTCNTCKKAEVVFPASAAKFDTQDVSVLSEKLPKQ